MTSPGSRRALGSLALCAAFLTLLAGFAAPASAQTPAISVVPGVLNLGMTASVSVTAPAAGAFTLVVVSPDGGRASLNLSFAAAGQTQTVAMGNATSGLKVAVNQVGTYSLFFEQGGQLVGSASLYATNKLNLSMDMVTGGTCAFISGATRGSKMFPRFYPTYASDGAALTNLTQGVYVTYTLPDGTKANATWHPPSPNAPDQGGSGGTTGYFIGQVLPNWNYTAVGQWTPTVVVGDAFGNTVTYTYTGTPFTISPATFSMDVQLVNENTGETVTGFYNGESVILRATVIYPTNSEPVPGFVAPLNSARGGKVEALVGWGAYNSTTNTFGGKSPGGLITSVNMTYATAISTWVGVFNTTSFPSLQLGTSYVVVVSASDEASPPNSGLSILALPQATVQTTTVTAAPAPTSIPALAYAGMAGFLVVGVVLGYLVRPRRKSQ